MGRVIANSFALVLYDLKSAVPSRNSQQAERQRQVSLRTFYKGGHWGTGRLSNWFKDTETVAGPGANPDLTAQSPLPIHVSMPSYD